MKNLQPEPDYEQLLDSLRLRAAANRYAVKQRQILQQAQDRIFRRIQPEN